jgi:hypothetical protein
MNMLLDAYAVARMWRGGMYPEACTSDIERSSFVDIYNATSNSWTTYPTGLGQARSHLAAASLVSGLVLFAGGFTGA